MRRFSGPLLALALAGCSREGPPALILELSSELAIPADTNNLSVHLRAEGLGDREESYMLGEAPRDQWPQLLPILAAESHPKLIDVAAELRVSQLGRPSVVVGFSEASLEFPASGEETRALVIARACVDGDDDGYGVGFGCAQPDCDDARRDVPESAPCPGFESPSAPDAGPDAGGEDAGPDAGAGDGGARPDAGRVDGGSSRCGMETCEADEVCQWERCWVACQDSSDCGEIHLGCVPRLGICMCRVPCRTTADCGPYECIDGCCQI